MLGHEIKRAYAGGHHVSQQVWPTPETQRYLKEKPALCPCCQKHEPRALDHFDIHTLGFFDNDSRYFCNECKSADHLIGQNVHDFTQQVRDASSAIVSIALKLELAGARRLTILNALQARIRAIKRARMNLQPHSV